MNIPELTLLSWAGYVAVVLIGIFALYLATLLLIASLKFLRVVKETCIDPTTGKLSGTPLQRWAAFGALMFVFIASHFTITTNPFHIAPTHLSEMEMFLIFGFVLGAKYLMDRGKQAEVPVINTPVTTSTTTVVTAPVGTEITKDQVSVEPAKFVLKKDE